MMFQTGKEKSLYVRRLGQPALQSYSISKTTENNAWEGPESEIVTKHEHDGEESMEIAFLDKNGNNDNDSTWSGVTNTLIYKNHNFNESKPLIYWCLYLNRSRFDFTEFAIFFY